MLKIKKKRNSHKTNKRILITFIFTMNPRTHSEIMKDKTKKHPAFY